MSPIQFFSPPTRWISLVLLLTATSALPAEDKPPLPPEAPGPTIEEHSFAGLLFVKHGLVGTRSEGPVYWLQSYRQDYQLIYKERHPWERDEALEALARKMVAVRGRLEDGKIMVERIQPIEAKLIPQPPLTSLIEGNNGFAFDLLKQLAGTGGAEPNLAVSPLSISTALGMTYAGAGGETAREMATVLGFRGIEPVLLHSAYSDLQRVLYQNPKADFYTIHAANRLWVDKAFQPDILPAFREITSRDYGAEIETLDFVTDTEGSRKTINDWVNEQTGQKIPQIIPQGGLDQRTRLVLTNALHFQGNWVSSFNPRLTAPAPFHVTPDQVVDVPTMSQNSVFPYLEDAEKQLVALPVRGGNFSMVLVLPRENTSLKAVRSSLNGRSFNQLALKMKPQQVELSLPKFAVKSGFQLAPTLSAMGMPQAFDETRADFSGINGQKDLFIQKVFHEALVDVNESGVEAAAATAVVIGVKSLPPDGKSVRFDRPFLFAIRDNRTGSVLFLGQVVNPKP